jgi:hypothetical protein
MYQQSFQADDPSWHRLMDALPRLVAEAASLEQAAQAVCRELYSAFAATTALVRMYAIVPLGGLPAELRDWLHGRVVVPGDGARFSPDVPVLALLGSYGAEPAWCSRHQSQRHRAIPLVSAAFVHTIPMLASLLKELGIPLDWLNDHNAVSTRLLIGGFNGVFFVEDAATAEDSLGRLVIPDRDFVSQAQVKTVFGFGGVYPDGTAVVAIVFTRERLQREDVQPLSRLISVFKGQSVSLILQRRLFATPTAR